MTQIEAFGLKCQELAREALTGALLKSEAPADITVKEAVDLVARAFEVEAKRLREGWAAAAR